MAEPQTPGLMPCPECGGTGKDPQHPVVDDNDVPLLCTHCAGAGYVEIEED